MMSTILYATDYSKASHYALPVAESLAREHGADLLIVHVVEAELAPVGELFDEEPEPPPEEIARLTAVRPADPRIAFQHRLLYGALRSDAVTNAAEELGKLARDKQVAFIVLGTQGREGLSHLLTGSVVEKLMRHAPCPVVAVRQPATGSGG